MYDSKFDLQCLAFDNFLEEYDTHIAMLMYLDSRPTLSKDLLDMFYISTGVECFTKRDIQNELRVATEGFWESVSNFFKLIWKLIKKYILRIKEDIPKKEKNIQKTEQEIKNTQEELKSTIDNPIMKRLYIAKKDLPEEQQNKINKILGEKDSEKFTEALDNIKKNDSKIREMLDFGDIVTDVTSELLQQGDKSNFWFIMEHRNIRVLEPNDELVSKAYKAIDNVTFKIKEINEVNEGKRNSFSDDGQTSDDASDFSNLLRNIENKSKNNIIEYVKNKQVLDNYCKFVKDKILPILSKLESFKGIYEFKTNHAIDIKLRGGITSILVEIKSNLFSITGMADEYSKVSNFLLDLYGKVLKACKEKLNKEFKDLVGMYPTEFIRAVNTIKI